MFVDLRSSLFFLVSTSVVCHRPSAMKGLPVFGMAIFFAQNSLSAPTQVFQECWSEPPPSPLPPPKMKIWANLGTWDLTWSGPPLKMKTYILMWNLVCGIDRLPILSSLIYLFINNFSVFSFGQRIGKSSGYRGDVWHEAAYFLFFF